ncbi:hypothetical protein CONCODRAFT_10838 [Conidiobolus coronatus NRRL 28638]|uniref:Uncharacterized protein n=1 Tax=Conidiobolus coronatus (strain ATCC 28846 / CBS 209.66 / NRRL 28638) TaxID=796925 RepID=A0A137NWF6_CONC2|nr:hypothetical protein CONCODRAFT_10838 [Conidiobolus coronatus NRRL 28638]|eukprot:KXN67160.1 hypothetical protein CONCODRAFT_10838 [Conidiobolus coronatus NRRL 28638]
MLITKEFRQFSVIWNNLDVNGVTFRRAGLFPFKIVTVTMDCDARITELKPEARSIWPEIFVLIRDIHTEPISTHL